MERNLRLGVFKFASCDGCQLTLLNLGEELLDLAERVDIVHFAEAGPVAPEAEIDVALVEGSISSQEGLQRLKEIRSHADHLITIGACAAAGGLQALRNTAQSNGWLASIYAAPRYIDTLDTSTPISRHVKVDFELSGCPVNGRELLGILHSLLAGVQPAIDTAKVCLECKRRGITCVMVARNLPCMGPVTRTGCGALCPSLGRGCYGCYGPSEVTNTDAVREKFLSLGLASPTISQAFLSFGAETPTFRQAGIKCLDKAHG